jgi:hypothetical protein
MGLQWQCWVDHRDFPQLFSCFPFAFEF